jgi:hypothetical protein
MADQPSRRARLTDLPALTETIGLAFADDPIWGHTFAHAKAPGVEAIWRIWIEGALRLDWVWNESIGFRPRGGFSLPDGGPVVTTMWRPGSEQTS